jgi:phosphoserine aminotransferase
MPTPVSFNVGPSQLYPEVRALLVQAYDSGVLAMSHRGAEFEAIYALAEQGLRRVLGVPADYRIYFVSSATEAWSILAECLVPSRALHLYSGSFGQRWYEQSAALRPSSTGIAFGVNDDPARLLLPLPKGIDLVALTHNETSNTTLLSSDFLASMRAQYGEAIIAVDVTSSLGGMALPWASADVWFGSVQKCLGMPAGLGVLICGPRAVQRAAELNRAEQYNSLVAIERNAAKHQTTHTPNVLGIYLLAHLLGQLPPIAEIERGLRTRAAAYYALLAEHSSLTPLVANERNRSITTIGVNGTLEQVSELKKQARGLGLILASGYGQWKTSSLRIANFPAIPQPAVDRLLDFLSTASV